MWSSHRARAVESAHERRSWRSLSLSEYPLQDTRCEKAQNKLYCGGLCSFSDHFSENLTWMKVNEVVPLHTVEGLWVSGGVNPLVLTSVGVVRAVGG